MEYVKNSEVQLPLSYQRKRISRFLSIREELKKQRTNHIYSEHQIHLQKLETRNQKLNPKALLEYRIYLWKKSTQVASDHRMENYQAQPHFQETQESEESVSDIDSAYIIKCHKKKRPSTEANSERLADELCMKE